MQSEKISSINMDDFSPSSHDFESFIGTISHNQNDLFFNLILFSCNVF